MKKFYYFDIPDYGVFEVEAHNEEEAKEQLVYSHLDDYQVEQAELVKVAALMPFALQPIYPLPPDGGDIRVAFELVDFQGEPAVIFQDGDVVLQREPLADFLMHLSILLPHRELPRKLVIMPMEGV